MRRRSLAIGICFLLICSGFIPITLGFNVKVSKIEQPYNISNGDTLYVGGSGPGNYTTIQSAIDDAVNGDTVFVYDDSSPYYEKINIRKSINLVGEDRNTTVIEGDKTMGFLEVEGVGINISGFTIRSGIPNPPAYYYGIFIDDYWGNGRNCNIFNNIFTNTKMGILLFHSGQNNVFNNFFIDNYLGIVIHDSGQNYIYQNIINKCEGGLLISSASKTANNYVHQNIITNNHEGISFDESDDIGRYVKGFEDNGEYKYIQSNNLNFNIDNNYIFSNEILYNRIGLNIDSRHNKGVINNYIFGNNFISNIESNAYVNWRLNTNYWDDKGFGNYWDDYSGKDFDGNGVGDTPYIIQESIFCSNKDNYPRMETYYEFNPNAPEAPIIIGPPEDFRSVPITHKFYTIDPNGDDVYYYISWDDGTFEKWVGPFASSENTYFTHVWKVEGYYYITAQAMDVNGQLGPLGSKFINIHGYKETYDSFFMRLLDGFPLLKEVILWLIR